MRQYLTHILCLFPTLYLMGQPPLLERIALYGNTRTKDHVILRELHLAEGKPLIETLLLKDRAWLLRQGFLKRIEFQVKPGSTEDKRFLILVVQEKVSWSISPILSNNDLFGWYTGVNLTYHNLWGRRNRIDATFQIGGIRKYGLAWSDPWFGGKLHLFTRLDIYHTHFPYLYGDHHPHFNERDTGVLLTVGKGIGRRIRTGIRIGMERIWVEDPTVTFSETHTDDISLLEGFFTFDSRDWPLYPRTGLYLQAWIHEFGLFQNHRFYRTGLDFNLYSPIYHDNILALQTSVQISQGKVPIYKRIHLGGGKTIRGYRTGLLSGENYFLTSLEYRFHIFYERNPLAGINVGYAGVLFLDAGAAWFQNQIVKPHMLHGSLGFGIHVIWDRWVFRAEYGNHGKGWGFINMGTGIKF